MAPRRRKRTVEFRPYKLMLPPDISDRIDQKAKDTGLPLNRVIINELASIPYLEKVADFAGQVEDMKTVLARYSSRIVMSDLSDELLAAVDAVLKTEGSAQQSAIDKLRVQRNAMLKHTKANT